MTGTASATRINWQEIHKWKPWLHKHVTTLSRQHDQVNKAWLVKDHVTSTNWVQLYRHSCPLTCTCSVVSVALAVSANLTQVMFRGLPWRSNSPCRIPSTWEEEKKWIIIYNINCVIHVSYVPAAVWHCTHDHSWRSSTSTRISLGNCSKTASKLHQYVHTSENFVWLLRNAAVAMIVCSTPAYSMIACGMMACCMTAGSLSAVSLLAVSLPAIPLP